MHGWRSELTSLATPVEAVPLECESPLRLPPKVQVQVQVVVVV